ncbi:aminotransferase class V-fold PLP-dependent enzyme [soil metagenome]
MSDSSVPLTFDAIAVRDAEFPSLRETVYLNAAAVAPLPNRSRVAVEAFNGRRSRIGELDDSCFEEPLRRCREAAARLIGADAGEIALGGNTSYGINLAALGLPLEPGTSALVSDREFPANVYPWMGLRDRGVELEIAGVDALGHPDEERLLERLERGGVSVFALSAVQFASGYRADLARLGAACRRTGTYFVGDAIQALGQVPIDVGAMQIDVLATGGHKWLCGPFGTGFAYVRRELHEVLRPRAIGWTAMQASADFAHLTDYRWEFLDDARRFELGTLPFQDLMGFACSMELLLEVGVERISAHLASLLEPLIAWLHHRPGVEMVSDLRPEHRSGIFCFRPPAAEVVFGALREGGVHCVLREGAIRLSPHLYNTREDIDLVMDILSSEMAD